MDMTRTAADEASATEICGGRAHDGMLAGTAGFDGVRLVREALLGPSDGALPTIERIIGEQAVQMHGGIGTIEESTVGLYYKRLLSRATLFGDVDYHVGRYAAELAA
jgi:hypothetical protein